METLEESIQIFPGIHAAYNFFEGESYVSDHAASPLLMEVNHCHYGRIGWDLNNGTSLYMGEGDLAVHSAALCAHSKIQFPLGRYEGITFAIDFSVLQQEVPEIVQSAHLDMQKIISSFCRQDRSFLFTTGPKIDQIFAPLYHLPEEMVLPYLKLKVQELLLFLYLQALDAPEQIAYGADSTETIRQIHALLTENLGTRYTIKDLSKEFLINTSTLKEVFKAVYGMPIGAYMKNYRIRHAAQLLLHTQDSVAVIAALVGYETQSKFTQAFKEIVGTTPIAYRKENFELKYS
ncbi:MAG: AraC family transcriptional regulator [Clostridiales bacterium]|nr:AraC family transcriptional regulator [Clostridiales bacterium]